MSGSNYRNPWHRISAAAVRTARNATLQLCHKLRLTPFARATALDAAMTALRHGRTADEAAKSGRNCALALAANSTNVLPPRSDKGASPSRSRRPAAAPTTTRSNA